MIPGIRDRQRIAFAGDPGGHVQCRRTDAPFGVATLGVEIRLTDDEVGREMVVDRRPPPDQDPVVTGVTDEQRSLGSRQIGSAGAEQGVGAGRDWLGQPNRVGLRSQHDSGPAQR